MNTLIVHRFICSCATKPFVILTGNSGTGKTKLAQHFAQWLSGKECYKIVPIGADWTDNRNVIGYFNPIRKAADGNGIYQSTPVLDLVLKASQPENEQKPFFLILDEMNLSHVERYFSDFLSVIESQEEIPLHSEDGKVISSGNGAEVPNFIKIPPNLFTIGTVNVDETTYMFSPKVLDRANVIEFRVEQEEFNNFIDGGIKRLELEEMSLPDLASSFLFLSYRARAISFNGQILSSLDIPPENFDKIKTTIKDLFEILAIEDQEFAFRTATEILRYALVDYALAPVISSDSTGIGTSKNWDWQLCMDIQILQRILPKIYGSRKIEPLLVALAEYCQEGEKDKAKGRLTSSNPVGQVAFNTSNTENYLFEYSYLKLARMIKTLRRNQFVSYI